MASRTAFASATRSTSRSRTSSRSGSRRASPQSSSASSIRSARSSPRRKRSARASARSESSTKGRRGSRPTSPGRPRLVIAAAEEPADRAALAPAFAAARARLGLIALLFVLAAVGWWWTARQMQDMDGGPWTELGTLAWFLGVWVVMMAAMMFPSVAPTVALYAKLKHTRALGAPLLFVSGYLLVWSAVGLVAYALARIGGQLFGDVLAWDSAGRWIAGATLLVAAVYELTPLKDVCLGRCRSPLGFLLGSWRDGLSGAMQMGARHGAWCVGCCWALMASLFALGVMSLVWMALVAGVIAFEKLIPSRRLATYGTAGLLLVLGVLMLVAPDVVPALTIPGTEPMSQMDQMSQMGEMSP